jgi:hypothetical protein
MSKNEILENLPKLTSEERYEIRLKLAELDGGGWLDDDDPLSDEEKALLNARLVDMEQHPERSIPWDEARRRIEGIHASLYLSARKRHNLFSSPAGIPALREAISTC